MDNKLYLEGSDGRRWICTDDCEIWKSRASSIWLEQFDGFDKEDALAAAIDITLYKTPGGNWVKCSHSLYANTLVCEQTTQEEADAWFAMHPHAVHALPSRQFDEELRLP